MKLTDIVFAVIIFSITSICFLQGYIGMEKNGLGVMNSIQNSNTVLQTDFLIRRKIKSVKIPYWKNAEKEVELEKIEILNSEFGDGIKIVSVETVKNKTNIDGFKVSWTYKNKKIETIEEFSSRTFIE